MHNKPHNTFLSGLWNEDSMFTNLSLTKASTVVYVGANNMGADGKRLMDMFNWYNGGMFLLS